MLSTGARLTRPHAQRALVIRTSPAVSNIGESREVHRLLSQFGEVEYYRHMRYDKIPSHGLAMVVFKDDESANRCLSRGRLEFTIGQDSDHRTDDTTDDSFEARITPLLMDTPSSNTEASPGGLPTPPPRKVYAPFQQHRDDNKSQRMFFMEPNRAITDMRKDINMGWFHGFFTPDYRRTPNEDLAARVPLRGMANVEWRQDKLAGRKQQAQRALDEEGPGRWIPLKELHNEYLKNGPTKQSAMRNDVGRADNSSFRNSKSSTQASIGGNDLDRLIRSTKERPLVTTASWSG